MTGGDYIYPQDNHRCMTENCQTNNINIPGKYQDPGVHLDHPDCGCPACGAAREVHRRAVMDAHLRSMHQPLRYDDDEPDSCNDESLADTSDAAHSDEEVHDAFLRHRDAFLHGRASALMPDLGEDDDDVDLAEDDSEDLVDPDPLEYSR